MTLFFSLLIRFREWRDRSRVDSLSRVQAVSELWRLPVERPQAPKHYVVGHLNLRVIRGQRRRAA